MSRPPATVAELERYWEWCRTVKPNDTMEYLENESENYISTYRMPPWEDICSQLYWRREAASGGDFPRFEGVYRLIGLADDDPEKPATLTRLHGNDTTGTLYIGQSSNLNRRLNQFLGVPVQYGYGNDHPAFLRWRASWILGERFPPQRLAFDMLRTPDGTAPGIEADLIRAYLNSFGDTPPLNCSF